MSVQSVIFTMSIRREVYANKGMYSRANTKLETILQVESIIRIGSVTSRRLILSRTTIVVDTSRSSRASHRRASSSMFILVSSFKENDSFRSITSSEIRSDGNGIERNDGFVGCKDDDVIDYFDDVGCDGESRERGQGDGGHDDGLGRAEKGRVMIEGGEFSTVSWRS